MIHSRLLSFVASVSISMAMPLLAVADMQIRLKDGRVITVPVDQNEVETILYGKPSGARPVAKRAADKIRKDGEQIRFATQAAKRAAEAAERADKAAKAAVKAAAAAKAASRDAAIAADDARRVAHKPPDVTEPSFTSPPSGKVPVTPPPQFRDGRVPTPGFSVAPPQAGGRVLSVGPGRTYRLPSAAAKAARDGDIIEIQAGTYRGDATVWRANNLVIRGIGGKVILDAAGRSAGGKAIWVIKGRNTTVQNIVFSGARVRDKNGAGIRLEGPGLIVRDSAFRGNEMGILTGSNPESDILIERSRFYRNTVDYPRYRRLGHNIYVGRVRSFTLRFSHISGARYGHNVKSRARTNRITYNKIVDGHDGMSSYLIDLHGAAASYIIGNVLQQGRKTENWAMISHGAENSQATAPLYVVNNTFVNDKGTGTFVHRRSDGETLLVNNLFVGGGTVLIGSGLLKSNLIVDRRKFGRLRGLISDQATRPAAGDLKGNLLSLDAAFVDRENLDYRLRERSPAIDAGIVPPKIAGDNLTPLFQIHGRTKPVRRYQRGGIDIGAYEYGTD